jgi:hypothetical protein
MFIIYYKINMGNKNSIIKENNCLICWEDLKNKNIYVKCSKCKIYIHDNCTYSYYRNKLTKKCPHCQHKFSLYYYNYENCYLI